MRLTLNWKTVLLAVAVIAASFFISLKAMDWLALMKEELTKLIEWKLYAAFNAGNVQPRCVLQAASNVVWLLGNTGPGVRDSNSSLLRTQPRMCARRCASLNQAWGAMAR